MPGQEHQEEQGISWRACQLSALWASTPVVAFQSVGVQSFAGSGKSSAMNHVISQLAANGTKSIVFYFSKARAEEAKEKVPAARQSRGGSHRPRLGESCAVKHLRDDKRITAVNDEEVKRRWATDDAAEAAFGVVFKEDEMNQSLREAIDALGPE